MSNQIDDRKEFEQMFKTKLSEREVMIFNVAWGNGWHAALAKGGPSEVEGGR